MLQFTLAALQSGLAAKTDLAGLTVKQFELATDDDRLEEYRRVAALNRHCGVEVEEISASEVAEMFH